MKISRTVLSECAKSRIRPAMRLKEKEITIEAPWGKIRVRLVREHYRWHKFIYIGHSLGVVLAYPGHISRMVELDPVPAHDSYRPDPAVIREWYHHFYHNYYGHEQYTKLNGGGDNAPKYSFEKALEMVMKNRSLHKEAAECILERAIAPAENGLYSPILRCAENSYFLIVLFHLPLNKGQIKTFFIVAWGSCADPPVLLCHGAVDSAASWRPIMEHLPPTFYYIGMELPGNGKSDPLPRGLMLATHDLVYAIEVLRRHFRWEHFVYMAHSLGTALGKQYNLAYPGRMTKVVEFDPIPAYQTITPDQFGLWYHAYFTKYYQKYHIFNAPKETAPLYTREKVGVFMM
ncbi:hypothetical protein MSG28_014626 [Choristoneura fumiferana]|uniref:Uncharacterized protein n=2 Tax=Choristoneura fumiferana TaxID=7141 RepID=A0ACC0JS76_CHOFU|nr:hypothetical protein MSG28_014626 [Choristoneura fumiferana]KAI8426963.1 hypothetical protein MSG28_014626 [Choristoneura fumiferana]